MTKDKVRTQEVEQTLRGRVERVTFASRETGFAVLRVRPSRGGLFTATGHVPELLNNAGLEGSEFQFFGTWTMTKYGRQFAFSRCRLMGSELLFFLSRVVKGLGERLASELIERFGEEKLCRILDERPQELLKVKGIKEKRLNLILRSWHKHRSLRALAEYLGGHASITPNLLIRIYNHFGDASLEIVRKNPYSLTEIRGIGFKTADKIALAIGVKQDSPFRIRAAVTHVLVEAAESDGNCFLMEGPFVDAVQEVLSSEDLVPERSLIMDVLEPMRLEGTLVIGPSGEIGLSAYKYMEDWLREFFSSRAKPGKRPLISAEEIQNFLERYEDSLGIELAQEQREIVRLVAGEPRMVFGLAGYAGTGKTTVCRAILDLLSDRYAVRDEMMCCAFTGMAASRLRKTTGYEALTIHALLKYKGDNQFEHGPEKPLPYRVMLLDEASMVSLPLFYRLARALRPSTLFILVGDPAQLPPIGAGNVFADALRCDLIPSVHLTQIYRQGPGSVLTLFANEIRQGKVPKGVEESSWQDFVFERLEKHNIYALKKGSTPRELKRFREENNQAILDRILELARQYKRSLTHPIWDFQVLTPMRVGQLGTEILNRELQKILNAEPGKKGISRAGIHIREGDKVVHLRNRDMPVMDWQSFIRQGKEFSSDGFRRIFNGNVGLVMRIDSEAQQFHVVYPERVVVAYDFDHLGDIIELAYALTVHKAQGSQYKIVVIPLTNSHFIMLNNKWFYTAITRAEEKVYLIGQRYALNRACTNVQGVARNTWLCKETSKGE